MMGNPITKWGTVSGVGGNASVQATALLNSSLAKLTDPLQKFEDKKIANEQIAYKKERTDNTAKMLQAKLLGVEYTPPNDNYDKMKFLEGSMEVDNYNQQKELTGLQIDKETANSNYYKSNAELTNSILKDNSIVSGITATNAPENARLGLASKRLGIKGQKIANSSGNLANQLNKKKIDSFDEDRALERSLTQSRITKNNRANTGGSGRSGGGLTDKDAVRIAAFNSELGQVSYDRPMTNKEVTSTAKALPIVAELLDDKRSKLQQDLDDVKSGNGFYKVDSSMYKRQVKKLENELNSLTLENSGVLESPVYKEVVKTLKARTTKANRKLKPSEVLDQTMSMLDAKGMTGQKAVILGYLAQQSSSKRVIKQKKNENITKDLYKMKADSKKAQDKKDNIKLRASLKAKKD